MIYPEGDALKERIHSRYSLVVLASKRAKQLKEGAPPLIDTSSTNSLTIALEEIAAGKVTYNEQVDSPEDDESPSSLPLDEQPFSAVAQEEALDSTTSAAGEAQPLGDQPEGIEEA